MVLESLRLPPFIQTDNGCMFSKEEVFLFSLRRLSSVATLHDTARNHFGRDYSQMSRAFKWFVQFINTRWKYKLEAGNLQFFWSRFPQYAAAIQTVLTNDFGVFFHEGYSSNIAMFINNVNHAICRPGGGPENPGGAGVERNDQLFQQAFYNGFFHFGFVCFMLVYVCLLGRLQIYIS